MLYDDSVVRDRPNQWGREEKLYPSYKKDYCRTAVGIVYSPLRERSDHTASEFDFVGCTVTTP